MFKIQKMMIPVGAFIVLILTCIGCNFKSNQETIDEIAETAYGNDIVTVDYKNIDSVVADVLHTMPEIQSEIDEIRSTFDKDNKSFSINNIHVENVPIEKLFSSKKRQFRFEVEKRLSDQKSEHLTASVAEEFTNNYLDALSIAEEVYGVTVSQQEVTKYIDEHIAPIVVEEKAAYAKALGLSTYELDYAFDRDIYVMDVLWEKLMPILF